MCTQIRIGHVECGESIPLGFVFKPLEEKDYTAEIHIQINDERWDLLTISARGFHPNSPPRYENCNSEQVEGVENAHEGFACSMPGVLKMSSQIMSFEKMEALVRASSASCGS